MFLVHTVQDTVRIAADTLASNTIESIQNEIDKKYPNRVIMDVGLVVGRYDNANDGERRKHELKKIQQQQQRSTTINHKKRQRTSTTTNNNTDRYSLLLPPNNDGGLVRIGHGVCVTGDSGSHYDCTFQLIVFRPFVNEVCIGKIDHSTVDGIYVTIGFFRNIFIPAYWMLSPSQYDPERNVWVWTPEYADDDDDNNNAADIDGNATIKVKSEDGLDLGNNDATTTTTTADTTPAPATNRYEMENGSEIRFKVKSINFTQITNTAKGMQATTISMGSQHTPSKIGSDSKAAAGGGTSSSNAIGTSTGMANDDNNNSNNRPSILRRSRSSSVTGTDDPNLLLLSSSTTNANAKKTLPSAMQIIASICEDGLGLTSWWTTTAVNDDEEEEQQEELATEQEDGIQQQENNNDNMDMNEDEYNYEGGEYYE